MSIKSLDRSFFSKKASYVSQVIEFYNLDRLVYCDHPINIRLLSEFFNNLQPTENRLVYKSRVAKTDISFSPGIWRSFLGCRESNSNLECYPNITEPVEGYDLNSIHETFFREPRDQGVNLVSAMRLSAPDNILYKVIIGCILPIVTRGQSKVRPHHLLTLHLMKNHLDFNIALNMFLCIVHFSTPVKKKIYMPLGHILTAWLESIGIRTDKGKQRPVKPLEYIHWRNFSLAGMAETNRGEIIWKAQQEGERVAQVEEVPPAAAQPNDQLSIILEKLTQIEDRQKQSELTLAELKRNQLQIQDTQDLLLKEQREVKEMVEKWINDSDESARI